MNLIFKLISFLVVTALIFSCTPSMVSKPGKLTALANGERNLQGVILDVHDHPIDGATVRIQATKNQTFSDQNGLFTLKGLEDKHSLTISAWKDGYYCGKAENITPPSDELQIRLIKYQTNDNPAYKWVPPVGENSCYSCKPAVTQIWLDNDAHADSAQNPRFLSMYNGTDLDGNRSPMTQFGYIRDYGNIPLPPDMSQPNYGPGYKLDFPYTDGNCAACHIPGTAVDQPYGVDPNSISGVDEFGIHCDFCHKTADILLDQDTGLPFANMPGVLSMDIRRPFPDDPERYQLFFGTFDDDNVPEEDTYLPLIEESKFCAACHYGIFWDEVIYNSFGEWLSSPYSDPSTGKTCQDCHMPAPSYLARKAITNVAPKTGGIDRDPNTIHAHTFPGSSNVELLQNAMTLTADAQKITDKVVVKVKINNDNTGHHVPTDSPLRNLILVVQAVDMNGVNLQFIAGPVIPDWGGIGNPEEGYYAGLPGKGYAKILQEVWTGVSPTGAYWNPTRVISDNRLSAFESDENTFAFAASANGESLVSVTLIYRRAFIELMDQKSWNFPDIIMNKVEIKVP